MDKLKFGVAVNMAVIKQINSAEANLLVKSAAKLNGCDAALLRDGYQKEVRLLSICQDVLCDIEFL